LQSHGYSFQPAAASSRFLLALAFRYSGKRPSADSDYVHSSAREELISGRRISVTTNNGREFAYKSARILSFCKQGLSLASRVINVALLLFERERDCIIKIRSLGRRDVAPLSEARLTPVLVIHVC
jgi:hypothetical protein